VWFTGPTRSRRYARLVTHPQDRPFDPTLDDAQGVDPVEMLRAMLKISSEDAAAVREDAAEAMRPSSLDIPTRSARPTTQGPDQ